MNRRDVVRRPARVRAIAAARAARTAPATRVGRAAWLAALLGAMAAGAGATPNVPAPPQARALVVTGATLHTVSGAVIENGRMRIERGRIVSIGAGDASGTGGTAVDIVDADVLALPGKHVYPGFINANSVVGISELESVRGTDDRIEAGPINPSARAVVAVNPDSELIAVTRAGGVLAELSVPQAERAGLIAGTSALLQLDGWTWEDMAVDPAVALHVRLPPMRFNPALFPPQFEPRLDALRKASAAQLQRLEDAFDAAAAYRTAVMAGPTGTGGDAVKLDTRWEAMRPVLDGRRPVFIEADDVVQIRHALGFAERRQFRLVIVGGADAWRLADVLRERRVPVVITGVHRLPERRGDDYDAPYRLAARLAEAGVSFCIARDASAFETPNDRNLPFEAATAAAFGLERDMALKAITLYPAQILGVADRLGSLEAGRLANFIVTDGDPLDIRNHVERAFVQGREVDLTNRQTRLAQKYREKYRQAPAAKP